MASPHPGFARRIVASVREWQVWTLRPVPKMYVIAVVVLDWVVTLAALVVAPGQVSLSHLGLYVALLGCGVIVVEASRTVGEPKGTDTHDLQGIWYLTIALLFPPGLAFLAPVLVEGTYRVARVPRIFRYRRVFSAATLSLGWGAASVVFHAAPTAIAGPAPRSGPHAITWLLLAAGCYLLSWTINVSLVLLAIRLATPEVRLRDAFGGRIAWVSDLIELSAAVTSAFVVAAAPVALLLALPPIALGQRSLLHAQLASQTRIDAQSGALTPVIWRYEADIDAFRAQRTHTPLAVALAEVDDFASMASAAGPEAADQVLRAVAAILADKLPPTAQVGRLRGAEFAIVLPGAAAVEARRLGVRIRDRLAAELVEVDKDGQLDFVLRPTVSIGVAGLTDSRQTVTELIAAADAALAEARAGGGNQVSVAPGTPSGPDPGVAQASAG
jgi:diguanylate cyclase (GGDEF)-like protein